VTPQTIILDSEPKRQRAIMVLSKLPLAKPLRVTVEPYREKRSLTANRRLWALHQLAAQATGNSADDMHEIALCRFYGYEEKKIGGIIRQIPLERSSTKDTKRFAEFMEATESWYIQEFGVFLE
jgi:hypothetical protein